MKQLFIDHHNGMTRTALVINGKLREIFHDRHENGSIVGRVFLGVVRNILPSQFVFVDIGKNKNAFMNLKPGDDIHIGQPILVQVYKDASGTKGAYVGQEINLNGRLVIINAIEKSQEKFAIGISNKITDKRERKRLRGIMHTLLPEGYGAIIRTNAQGKEAEDFVSEVERLAARHRDIVNRAKYARAPALLYQENNLLHDLLSDDIQEIHVNEPDTYEAFMQMDAFSERVVFHHNKQLFDNQGLTRQIKHALHKSVTLPCGGFITIEQTEACVIIDVNTGSFAGKKNYRETILATNLEAAECIAWEITLRNLSGMIIVDFIDMETQEDKQALVKTFAEYLKKDRIKTEIVGMTELGLVQLTRKKTRESLSRLLEQRCSHCNGTGLVKKG